MSALVTIKGTITNTVIWQPMNGQKGKPVLKIDVLQVNDLGTHVETIKDDDINARYISGQQVELDCTLTSWAFDKRNGATLKVYRGEKQEIELKIQHYIPIGKESVKSK